MLTPEAQSAFRAAVMEIMQPEVLSKAIAAAVMKTIAERMSKYAAELEGRSTATQASEIVDVRRRAAVAREVSVILFRAADV